MIPASFMVAGIILLFFIKKKGSVMFMNKQESLRIISEIEHCFTEIKNNTDVHENLKGIKKLLGRMDIHVESITIVPADKDEFFGMSVFPTVSVAEKLVEAMIDKKPEQGFIDIWEGEKEWVIEIDSKLINVSDLNANPREITAALLHEIGHTIYSNTIPSKLHKTMSYAYLQVPSEVKNILSNKNKIFMSLYLPSVAQASRTTSYNLKKELEADKYVVQMGYGEALDALLQKILMRFGTRYTEFSGKELEKDIKVATVWAHVNAQELRFRKDTLRNSINKISLTNPSAYVQNLFSKINDKVFKGSISFTELASRGNRGKYVRESTDFVDDLVGFPCNSVLEAAFNAKKDSYGKLRKVNQHDIDIVAVQIDKIDNQNDKIYLLDVIYDYLETIDMSINAINEGNQNLVKNNMRQLTDMAEQLQTLRKQVLSTKIVEKRYGVFIKYPKGYEG